MAEKEVVPAMRRPEWLPEGWSVEYRKRRFSKAVDKYYIHPSSTKKLRSKPEVVRFLSKKQTDVNHTALRKVVSCGRAHKGQRHKAVQVDHCPSDLLKSCIVERRLRKSARYKGQTDSYYIHPSSAKKLRSKSEVKRFLSKEQTDVNHTAFQKAVSCRKSHNEQHHKALVKVDHCPSDLPEGWIVERRRRKSGRSKGQIDSYYIDPIYGHKFRSKMEVSRYLNTLKDHRLGYGQKRMRTPNTHLLKEEDALYDPVNGHKFHSKKEASPYQSNQAVSQIPCRKTRMHTPDCRLLKNEDILPLTGFKKSKMKQTVIRKELIMTKEQTLIEYMKSQVKQTVTRRRLVLTKEPVSSSGTESARVDSLQNPVSSLLLEASAQCTEGKYANPQPKPAPQLLLAASKQLEANSVENCSTTTTVEDIENLEQKMRNIRIQCRENCGEYGEGRSMVIPFEGKWLDLRQKKKEKRKAAIEYDLPSKYLKNLSTVRPNKDSDFDAEKGTREELANIIDQDYQREMSIPRELEEKFEKLQLFVEQPSNIKCEIISDDQLEKLGKLDLSRACMGDLWLDPCIEFAYKTLTSDFLVSEDMAKACLYPNS